jgi:hypothetical protein
MPTGSAQKIDSVLDQLSRFGIDRISHSQQVLLDHLRGTAEILMRWSCGDRLIFGGLCHSIYGTESFQKQPATLENRAYLQEVIGVPAERLAYLFGVHKKDSLWDNLSRPDAYSVVDRFTDEIVQIGESDFCDLITLTLANWLEQRPRAGAEHQFLRSDEFSAAKNFLPKVAYDEFSKAYGIGQN